MVDSGPGDPAQAQLSVVPASADALDEELARRLRCLPDEFRGADCIETSKPMFLRGFVWFVVGLGLWLLCVLSLP
jgi:hypothetical protein